MFSTFHARRMGAAAAAFGLAISAFAQLQPFLLPWNDDSSGITDLRAWQPSAAGAAGWVSVTNDGHYTVGGERIRFLGVNVGAGAAFPTHALADIHAARLARFGVNSVRLHHLEAPWEADNVLIDYASGSSRQLSAERLERMHYFVAALASEGIYTNLNLLVSREFQSTDGLGPEITQMGWKDQHLLGFFNDSALALHQEHATNLLTAPNPHRGGTPLAHDPAVAIVEIMNENGLAQKWYEDVLDTMPEVYRAQLAGRWNTWLHTRYPDTATMLAAWGSIDEPLGANQLTNGTFDAGTTGWNPEQHDNAVATFTRTTEFTGGASSLRINVTTAGSADWHVQVNQNPLTLVEGQVYTASFWAKANTPIPLNASISQAYPPDWSALAPGLSTTLGTAWTYYSWTFQAGVADTNARLNFGGFGDRVSTVWLADVRFSPGGKIGGLPPGASLETDSVPNVPHLPSVLAPTSAQSRDWLECLRALEQTYWTTMYQHVKTTLGYGGIVWGTIISNSAPNSQANFDAMDSHSYWQHPQFPSDSPWDPVNWTVNNISMVNDASSGTLGNLARQRVLGMPHNVTEYQHPSPNTYSSEAPLLTAAYGSLQDWDGIWLFDYTTVDASGAGVINSYFDQAQHPPKMANTLLAAALFRRGDVAAANNNFVMRFTPDMEIDIQNTIGSAWSVGDGSHLGVPASLALVSRLSLDIGPDAQGLDTPPAAPIGPFIVSDTSELTWDNSRTAKGVVTVDTALTKAVIGFIDGRSFDLGGVEISPGTTRQDWCTLGVTLLEGTSFTDTNGGRALVVATGDIENTGMIWTNSARESVSDNWGTAPTLIEVVPATITLPVEATRVRGWMLDGSGQRVTAVPVTDASGQALVTIGGSGATLWYEIEITPVPAAPSITVQPTNSSVIAGMPTTLSVSTDGFPAPTFQWQLDGVDIPGATESSYAVPSAQRFHGGNYTAVVTNSVGSVTSNVATVSIDAALPSAARLLSLSTRAISLTGDDVLIPGFVINGTGTKQLLIRAVGPTLGKDPFNLGGALADPTMTLKKWNAALQQYDDVAANDNWEDNANAADITTTAASLYAFSFNDSLEAALLMDLGPGQYTVIASGVGNATGVAIVELYDADTATTATLTSISNRGFAGTGNQVMIPGFVVSDEGPKTFLIRVVGPTLAGAPYNVSGTMDDPQLSIFQRDAGTGAETLLLRNDNWGDNPDWAYTEQIAQQVFAFDLQTGSEDGALVVTLEPGIYTVVGSSADGVSTGVVLVEVYVVQ